ncbi:MAG TPA: ATP-binding protein [Bacillota bacterium]|nr:ATP-binding protein [Bacillota bacterium]HPT67718.1 ATP-binding protein [Bacillota bacterium]
MALNILSYLKRSAPTQELRINLALKVTIFITVSIFLVASITAAIILNHNYRTIIRQIKGQLLSAASTTALTLDTEQLLSVRNQGDENSSAYKNLQKHLQNMIAASNGQFKYIYVIAKVGDSYQYLIDTTPSNPPDHSPIGMPFNIQAFPKALAAFGQPVVEDEPSYDPEVGGFFQSGYAPILDRQGNVLGIVGVDMDVSVLQQNRAKVIKTAGLTLLASLLLAVLLGIACAHYFTEPILILTKATQKIMDGDFSQTVNIRRHDELGLLAKSFNAMTAGLRSSRESLQQSKEKLESEVHRRTIELTRINREIRDILDHIDEIIFTINPDFILYSQYSRKATELFGSKEFAGMNLLDLLFPDENQKQDKENLASWLNLAFSPDQIMGWSDIEALQPVTELTCTTPDGKKKHLSLSFRPILDKHSEEGHRPEAKMMVILQDLTEKHKLQMAMEQKEQEYKDNINQIVEIIKLDQDLFCNFINECQEHIAAFEPKLIQLQKEPDNTELIADLFRIMHTIKGNARFFKLNRIAEEAHQFEEVFSCLQAGTRFLTDELLNELFAKLDRFNAIFKETMEIYNRIAKGKNLDTGKTRSKHRTQEECETIRIRIEDLNHIVSLIQAAEELAMDQKNNSQNNQDIYGSIQNILKETQTTLETLRKVPLGKLFARFPRMVRDISLELGKKTALIIEGESIVLDKVIFERVGDPIIHVLRNAVDHGIERPEDRIAKGKPEEGTITLKAELIQSELVITVTDDGKGIDPAAIKKKALEKGLITVQQAETLSDEEAIHLIFLPGFSTNDYITRVSGRGVGMDVVKTVIEDDLHGWVDLNSRLNQGLTVTLHVPLPEDNRATETKTN